ncbi:hypothetical protein [Streptomyces sp. URMC 123]|uniref:hypothetical protein n=1 Tax=Streptomyces sp. URMC 123 TaxID=3423403 RepID=UPI003F1D25D6
MHRPTPRTSPRSSAAPRSSTPAPRRAGAAALVTAATLLFAGLAAAGCGIRGTSVPVDAGPAPSRKSCDAQDRAAPDGANSVPVKIFLVCNRQLEEVGRRVPLPDDRTASDRRRVARALLAELRQELTGAEDEAGLSTEVPAQLELTDSRSGDPEEALRLNRLPDELPAFALAQVVCTYATSPAVGRDRAVVLGGPGDAPLLRFTCTEEMRSRPDTATVTGTPLG